MKQWKRCARPIKFSTERLARSGSGSCRSSGPNTRHRCSPCSGSLASSPTRWPRGAAHATGSPRSESGRRPVGSDKPLASGRDADVFALGNGRVLRRYRDGSDATAEAELMAYVAGHGFPVPAVYAVDGADIEMELLDGSTMLDAL